MKQAKCAIVMVVFAVTVSCTNHLLPATPPPPVAEVLPVYFTTDTNPLFNLIAADAYESEPNIIFEHHSDNHQSLLRQLDDGEIAYFISHHNPANSTQQRWSAPLAQDALVLIVHRSNPITNMTVQQIRRIYRGFISNWSEVGGNNGEITFYSRETGAGIRLEFERLVMGQQRTSPNARVLSSSQLIIEQIADDPQGIGYIPLSLLDEANKPIAIDTILPSLTGVIDNSYPLRATIYVIGQQEPTSAYRQLFIWIQNIGQESLSGIYAPLPR